MTSDLPGYDSQVPGLIMMKDISMVKGEFGVGEKVVNKIQDFQVNDIPLTINAQCYKDACLLV